MFDNLKDKKVKVGVAFMPVIGMGSMTTKYFEGIVLGTATMGNEYFLLLGDDSMINMKYVQTIEIIG